MLLIDCCLTWSGAGELTLSENDHRRIQNHSTQLILLVVENAKCNPQIQIQNWMSFRSFCSAIINCLSICVLELITWQLSSAESFVRWSRPPPGAAAISQTSYRSQSNICHVCFLASLLWWWEADITIVIPFFFFFSLSCILSVCVFINFSRRKVCACTLPAQLSKLSINRGLRPKLPAVLMDTFATSSLQFVWQLWRKAESSGAQTQDEGQLRPSRHSEAITDWSHMHQTPVLRYAYDWSGNRTSANWLTFKDCNNEKVPQTFGSLR